jgi:hypothetical protein
MYREAMAGTYVQITRQEFEDWLDSIGFRGKWQVKPGRGGVYQLSLSPTVMIEINSTTGSQAQVRGRGQASMSLRLVSRVTGKTLNRKAMGQSHFARTINWRQNWAKGVDRMKATYEASKAWYDQIAKIADRDQYKADTLAKIESIPNWSQDGFLGSLHDRVNGGGVLTERQESALDRVIRQHSRSTPEAPPQQPAESAPSYDLEMLRELYRRARANGDRWTVGFVGDLGQKIKAGRPLSDRQREVLDDKIEQYNLGGRNNRRAFLVW